MSESVGCQEMLHNIEPDFVHLPLSSSEMTEEEMIDLALHLSEQEASIVAIRRQKEEEEAMMKAIQESVSTEHLTVHKYGQLNDLCHICYLPNRLIHQRDLIQEAPVFFILRFIVKSFIVLCR